jgi:chromosome partitioning protein
MKGGVGKTTIAALLGRYASMHLNLNVLAIDLDPQANLSQAYMGERRYRQLLENKSPSIVEVFQGYQPPTSSTPSSSPLEVSNVVVSNTDWGGRNLDLIPSRFDFSEHLIRSVKPNERVLARLIAEEFQDKDIIIVDCAPTESILTRSAYHASRYVLVPVKPEYLATIGFPLLNESLTTFKNENRGHTIDVIGVVINNSSYHYSGNRGGPERATAMREILEEATKNGWHIFQKQIPFSRGFPKMMRGDFNYPGNATDYVSFTREFFDRLGLRLDQDG